MDIDAVRTEYEKRMVGLPALHSVAKCPKCGARPSASRGRDGRERTGFGLRYQHPGQGCTHDGQVSGAMTRYCTCGYDWAERPLDVPGGGDGAREGIPMTANRTTLAERLRANADALDSAVVRAALGPTDDAIADLRNAAAALSAPAWNRERLADILEPMMPSLFFEESSRAAAYRVLDAVAAAEAGRG